jgi:hypothetical protein
LRALLVQKKVKFGHFFSTFFLISYAVQNIFLFLVFVLVFLRKYYFFSFLVFLPQKNGFFCVFLLVISSMCALFFILFFNQSTRTSLVEVLVYFCVRENVRKIVFACFVGGFVAFFCTFWVKICIFLLFLFAYMLFLF